MNNSNEMIGEVISVSGNTLQIQAYQSIEENGTRIGEMGSFIKIVANVATVFGVVTDTKSISISKHTNPVEEDEYIQKFGKQIITVVLVGEIENDDFVRGISQYPIITDKCYLTNEQDLKTIYENKDSCGIDIGKISGLNHKAYLNLDKLLSRHSAILGTTGSGKLNAVGTLLKRISDQDYPSARILVIDPHGEYNSVLKEKSIVYKIRPSETEKELCVPYWALSFDDLLGIIGGNISDPNKEYIKDKIVEYKINSAKINNINIPEEIISADTPIPYSIKSLWFELEDFERQTYYERANPLTKTPLIKIGNAEKLIPNEYTPASAGGGAPFLNNQAKGLISFLENMKLKMKDASYDFLFNPKEWLPDLNGVCKKDLDELLFNWLNADKSISIFDISEVPTEIMTTISGTILKQIYDALYWGQNMNIGGKKRPMLVILEEAHNYLKNGENTVASKTIQKIAKEGRKYGVGLCLVSQRPSELDETVLSQCGTIISLRMNNSKDKNRVAGSIQDELKVMVDMLPSLKIGEAIISGEAIKIPSKVRFYKLEDAPKGSDPNASKQWSEWPNSKIGDYKELVEKWRNKKN